MNGKRFSESKARKNGFYVALAVCLAAVGVAAWSTYDAVQSYTETEGVVSQTSSMEDGEASSAPAKETKAASLTSDSSEAPRAETSQTAGRGTSAGTSAPSSAAPAESGADGEDGAQAPEREAANQREQIPVNAPLYELSSQMIYPVSSGEVVKAYSAGAPVYSQTMKDWRIHAGTDVKADAGEEVHACANGQVKQTYTDSMLGNVIVVEHGDYEFSYCGVSENFLVKEGDVVTKGQAIGTVTAVPFEAAEDVHLHVQVRRDGAYLNPQEVIEGKA